MFAFFDARVLKHLHGDRAAAILLKMDIRH